MPNQNEVQKRILAKWLKKAESAFPTVLFSGPDPLDGDAEYTPLPYKFNSKKKIYRFFRQYWSKRLAKNMVSNLRLRNINGKLSVPVGDIVLESNVTALKILVDDPARKVIKARLGEPDSPFKEIVTYYLTKEAPNNKFVITSRSPADFRYADPMALEE